MSGVPFPYFGKSSDQIFRDLVFFTNGYRLPVETTVVWVGPNPLQSTDPLNRDTQAEIRIPRHDPGYRHTHTTGSQMVTYSRLQLTTLQPRWDRYFTPPSVDGSTYDILDQINDYFETVLTVQDLEDIAYSAANFTLVLKAKSTSVAWQGQYGNAPQVSDLIPVKKLIGFTIYSDAAIPVAIPNVLLSGFTPTVSNPPN